MDLTLCRRVLLRTAPWILAAACSPSTPASSGPQDAAPAPVDMAPAPTDAAPAPADAAPIPMDAAPVPVDASPAPLDAAPPPVDAAPPPVDAAPPPVDAAPLPIDAAPLPIDAALIPDVAPIPDAALIPDAAPILDAAPIPDADPGPPPCDPPLMLEPTRSAVLPFDLLVLHAEGGTGDYTFTLVQDGSGALLNTFTGAYLSGDQRDTVDIIRVTDGACAGSAEVSIRVVAAVQVSPQAAEVRPGQSFAYEFTGGSGTLAFTLGAGSRSGGSVDIDGAYTAGPRPGRDFIDVRDLETDERASVAVDVVQGAVLRPEPSRVGLPVGSTWRPVVLGGTRTLEVDVEPDAARPPEAPAVVDYADGVLRGLSTGEVVVRFTDHFTRDVVRVPVHVAAPLQTPLLRSGDNTYFPMAPNAVDINGDGYRDLVLGLHEADHAGVGAGSVMVYRGRSDGVDAQPIRVISGVDRRDELGRGLMLEDYDDDGWVDLFIGAPVGDLGSADRGVVTVYRGVPGAFFEEFPSFTLTSPRGGDRFGQSIGVCDVNGDGRKDLIVGATGLDDITVTPNVADQGGLFVHLGYEDGFLAVADQRILARTPDGGGGTRYTTTPRFGHLVATGDFNGDGLCDVATAGLSYAFNSARTADGGVAIYSGRRPDALSPGGLEPLPARFITASAELDPDSNFGRVIASADVDADGFTDLLVGQPNHELIPGRSENHGAARLYRGGPFPPPGTVEAAEVADWTYEHNGSSDNAGFWVSFGEATGDGHPDVLVGVWRDEAVGGTPDVGAALVFAGRVGAVPEAAASRVFYGRNSTRDERFGSAIVALDDYDQDGLPELMVYVSRAPDEGFEVGLPLLVGGATPGVFGQLAHPWPASGVEVGRGVGFNDDVDGDGNPEIVVGVHSADPAAQGVNAGLAYLHPLRPDGPDALPARTLQGFTGHSGSDLFGAFVSNMGDFDGDGLSDLGVLARSDDRPASAPAGVLADAACLGALQDTAAVHIWRGRAGAPIDASANMVWFPGLRSSAAEAFAGGFDANGDGRSDLLLGGYGWDIQVGPTGGIVNNVGAFQLILGRSARGNQTEYICPQALEAFDTVDGNNLGRAVVGIGDVDGDGCDEFAVSTLRETYNGLTLQGAVRVFRGYGGPGCPIGPMAAALVPNERNAQAGHAMAGGADFDLDGRPDLAIAGLNHVTGPNTVGGVWVLPGAFLAGLDYQQFAGIAPLANPRNFSDAGAQFLLQGTTNGERFGFSVAWVPGRDPSEPACLAVGAPVADTSGVARAGAVKVFCPTNGVFPLTPTAVFGGETSRVLSRFGEFIAAGVAHGRRWIVVGAPEASGLSIDYGAAYVFPLDPP